MTAEIHQHRAPVVSSAEQPAAMSDAYLVQASSSIPKLQQTPATVTAAVTTSTTTVGRNRGKRVFKVIVIGDAAVGKTCLSFRFCNGRFPERTEATIGVDFRERLLEIDGELIKVQLWDTAGQERFRQSMTSHYYRNVHAVVFVYDMTNAESFRNLTHWIAECTAHGVSAATGDTPMLIIGNKCDQVDAVAVPTGDAQRFADSQNMALFETSAKAQGQADHVESILLTLVHKLKDSKPMHVQSEGERLTLNRQQQLNNVDQVTADSWLCGCV